MIDVTTRARDLIERAEATSRLPRLGTERTADMILQHRELRELLLEMTEFLEGHRTEHLRLTELVFALLGTVTAGSNGRASWMTALPAGTAANFRRALNAVIKHMQGEG
jgi:hypothetical protein